jgi:hypothetical protein
VRHELSRARERMLCAAPLAGAGILLALLALSARAQNAPPVWVSLDNSPAGSPARITVDPQLSGPFHSEVDVVIPGFWITQRIGTDNLTYQQLEVPGLGVVGQLGAPQLPVASFDLGLVVDGQGVVPGQPQVVQSVTLPGYRVWPQPIEERDGGNPEQFVRDAQVYGTPGPWPQGAGIALDRQGRLFGTLPYAEFTLNPFHWDPVSGDLAVWTHVRAVVETPGTIHPYAPITKTKSDACAGLMANWSAIAPYLPADPVTYEGYFLFIYSSVYRAQLQPLIDQKKARGFHVHLETFGQTGNTCDSIRAAIKAWYDATPGTGDHFCFLVGDVDSIPMCTSPNGLTTDALYGSTDGDDLDPEVLVGRLSVHVGWDVANQVAKLLAYEDKPPSDGRLGDVLLMAWREERERVAQETVRTASYAAPPTFLQVYGTELWVTNDVVSATIEQGVGVVAFVGHGFSQGWGSWDMLEQDYSNTDIFALANGPRTPVVWSISCLTGDLTPAYGMGEGWMSQSGGNGGVGFFGCTMPVHVWYGLLLNPLLFNEVYDRGTTLQAYAYHNTLHRTELAARNSEAYLFDFLGDPQMSIRRRDPVLIIPPLPKVEAVPCAGGTCREISIGPLFAPGGTLLVGAKVAAWKPLAGAAAARATMAGATAAQEQDELLDNRYADANGIAHIPAPVLSDGTLYYTIESGDSVSVRDSVRIVNGAVAGVPAVAAAPALFRAVPSVTGGPARFLFGRPLRHDARVRLFDLAGRVVRSIAARTGEWSAAWDGRDDSGARVAPGVYLARLEDGRAGASARVVVLR